MIIIPIKWLQLGIYPIFRQTHMLTDVKTSKILEKKHHTSQEKYEFTDFGLIYVKHLPTKHGDILVKFYGISLS
jgi:hypothetical protein